MNTDTDYHKKIAPDITKAAEILSRRFPSLEYDDIKQDLWVYVLGRKSPLLAADEHGTPVNYLVQNGSRICGQRLAGANPRPDDYYYSAITVRVLFEEGALTYSVTGDLEGRSDLVEGMAALTQTERNVILRAYVDNDPAYAVADSGKKKAAQRALDRLVYEMNRIGESRSLWHQDREVTGFIGSRSLMDQRVPSY